MKKISILKLAASVAFALGAQHATAAECWKAVSWETNEDSRLPVANVVTQDCTVTPAGYEWLEPYEVHDFYGDYNYDEMHLALQPSVFDGYEAPVITYRGRDTGGAPIYMLDLIVGDSYRPATTTTPPESPEDNYTYWTPWLDRDDASGTGDWENRSAFSADQVCEYPLSIETRLNGGAQVWTAFDQTPDYLASFDPQAGLVCKNADQADGTCGDYQVRFQCQQGTWGSWLNRDTQSGSGDWEILSGFSSSQVCAEPIDIKARVAGSTQLISVAADAPDYLTVFTPASGLVCENAAQGDTVCENYEVRFLCL